MNFRALIKLILFPVLFIGVLDLVFALFSLLVFEDGVFQYFYEPGLLYVALSSLTLIALRYEINRIHFQEAVFFVTSSWWVMGALAAVPFMEINGLSFTDAVFESVSALTTTGATVLSGLDDMPPTLLMYRQILQWFGGLGIIIFMVAVMPMLNIGGMRMYKAETPGPMKDDKLVPRISKSTRFLWAVYVLITMSCAVCYYIAGMSWFDAIGHSFSTVSTGGFSTHDASMGYFDSVAMEIIADVFMIAGAVNFSVHFVFLRSWKPLTYLKDDETRWFLLILAVASLLVAINLSLTSTYGSFWQSLRYSVFQIISFMTSTGFGSAGFTEWPMFCAGVMIVVAYIGGCAGSTAGGNKVIRYLIALKVAYQDIKQLIHPRGVFTIKINRRPVAPDVLDSIRGFLILSLAVTLVLIILVMWLDDLPLWTAVSAVAACVNDLGPGFAELGSNFQPLGDVSTWLMSLAMILGRLEYFTVLVLLSAGFWRRHAH